LTADSKPAFIDAFVLAGGASSRMGSDKALLSVGGMTLVERALRLLAEFAVTPRIVAARPDLERYAPVVQDLRKGCGPLSGIEAGLLTSESDLALFIPVDVPLLPASLLRRLISRASITGALATVPRLLGQVEPLCAVYRRDLLPAISRALTAGDLKVMRVIEHAASDLLGTIDIFDMETVLTAEGDFRGWPLVRGRALLNCNTPADLQQVHANMSAHPIH
jgi:molybdopterin-guanine dinucleotide biosynthesis protein A